jgi:hypothetical protein
MLNAIMLGVVANAILLNVSMFLYAECSALCFAQ